MGGGGGGGLKHLAFHGTHTCVSEWCPCTTSGMQRDHLIPCTGGLEVDINKSSSCDMEFRFINV